MEVVFGIILIVASLFLIVAVLMQSGKSGKGLSGAIAGGAETFFGKSKADTLDKKLSKLTTIVAIVFAVLVIVMYLVQDTTNYAEYVNPTAGIDLTDFTAEGEGAETAEGEIETGEAAAETAEQ